MEHVWPVADIRGDRSEKVLPSNIGVVVYLNDASPGLSGELAPAFVYRQSRPKSARYTLILRTPQTTLREVRYTITAVPEPSRRFRQPAGDSEHRAGAVRSQQSRVSRHRRRLAAGGQVPPAHRVHSGRVDVFRSCATSRSTTPASSDEPDDGWRSKSVKRTPKRAAHKPTGLSRSTVALIAIWIATAIAVAFAHSQRPSAAVALDVQASTIGFRLSGSSPQLVLGTTNVGSLTIAGFKALSARARHRDVLERPSRVARGFGCVAHRQARIARSNLGGSPGSHQHQQGP